MTPVRVDFELHWNISPSLWQTDLFHDALKNQTRRYPYRVYLNEELLAEREFNVHDKFYMHETHFFKLDNGQYTINVQDLSGLLDISIKDFMLDGVKQPTWVFNIT